MWWPFRFILLRGSWEMFWDVGCTFRFILLRGSWKMFWDVGCTFRFILLRGSWKMFWDVGYMSDYRSSNFGAEEKKGQRCHEENDDDSDEMLPASKKPHGQIASTSTRRLVVDTSGCGC
jgi:hypothetical protein